MIRKQEPTRAEFTISGLHDMLAKPSLPDARARDLCASAQRGNDDAMEELCSSFAALAMALSTAFATYMTPYSMDAEDLFSSAMEYGIKYGVHRYNVESKVPFQNWVALCMRRQLTKQVRLEEKHQEQHGLYAQTVMDILAQRNEEKQEHEHHRCMLLTLARAAVKAGKLRECEAEAIVMRANGLSNAEVAVLLGVSVNTVHRTWMPHAANVLRSMAGTE